MHFGNIVRKNAGQSIPTDVVEKLIAEYPSCMGVAVPSKDENDAASLLVDTSEDPPTKEGFGELMESLKDTAAYFYFGEFPQGFLKEDVQPFTMFEDEEGPVMVLFAEGDFENEAVADSNHSPEYHSWQNFIQPYVSELIKKMGDEPDADKFLGLFDDPIHKRALQGAFTNRGTLLFVMRDGKTKLISRNKEEREYPWGYMSSNMEVPVAMGKPAPEAKKGGGLLANLRKGATEVVKAAVKTPESETPSAAEPKTVAPLNGDEEIPWTPGPEYKSYGDLRDIYQRVYGTLPERYKQRPTVMVKRSKLKKLGVLKDFKDLPVAIEQQKKDTTAHHVPTAADMPIISGKIKDEVKAMIEKMQTPSPEVLQKFEKDFSTFTEATGISLNDVEEKPSILFPLANMPDWKPALMSLLWSQIKERRELSEALDVATGKIKELEDLLEKETAPTATAPAKSTEEKPAPAKTGSLFARLKKTT